MARSLDAPDSYDGVAQTVEAISETVHGAAGEDPWVVPALSGGVGAAPGSTDNHAQIVTVVPQWLGWVSPPQWLGWVLNLNSSYT